jgi:hypothetical protein
MPWFLFGFPIAVRGRVVLIAFFYAISLIGVIALDLAGIAKVTAA